jgi:hypothetical protein
MAAGNSNSPNVMSDSPIENLHQDVCCHEFLYNTGVNSVWLDCIEFSVDLQYLEIKKQKNSSFLGAQGKGKTCQGSKMAEHTPHTLIF